MKELQQGIVDYIPLDKVYDIPIKLRDYGFYQEPYWMFINPILGIRKNAYLINQYGDIYSLLTSQHLCPTLNDYGYYAIKLMMSEGQLKRKHFYVHDLIMYTFAYFPGCEDPNWTVDHINGHKSIEDNYIWNLRWLTKSENLKDAWRTGKCHAMYGEDSNSAKITNDDAINVKNMIISQNVTVEQMIELAEGDLTEDIIHKIKNGQNWSHLFTTTELIKMKEARIPIGFDDENNPIYQRITKQTAINIRDAILSEQYTSSEIARYNNCSVDTVYNIKIGRTWSWLSTSEQLEALKNSKFRFENNGPFSLGEDNPEAKITRDIVRKVYDLIMSGLYTRTEIIEMIGDPFTDNMFRHIKNGEKWTWCFSPEELVAMKSKCVAHARDNNGNLIYRNLGDEVYNSYCKFFEDHIDEYRALGYGWKTKLCKAAVVAAGQEPTKQAINTANHLLLKESKKEICNKYNYDVR